MLNPLKIKLVPIWLWFNLIVLDSCLRVRNFPENSMHTE